MERSVSRLGLVSLAGRQLLAVEILGGRRVGIRIEAAREGQTGQKSDQPDLYF